MDLEAFLAEWHNDSPTVLVHTSGSTGKPKPMLVEKRRMQASARITCRFLGLHEGDTALLCMPLDYIAGKMMVVRALTCGLQLVSVPPSSHPLATSHLSPFPSRLDFAAMVPLQVWNSLQVPEERHRLMHIRHLIIGGGAIDQALASQLADFPHQVWSTYGMTETLSHIALRRLNGPEASDWYTPFDGVALSLTDEGCLVISAPAVHEGPLVTNDIAELSPPGVSPRRLRVSPRQFPPAIPHPGPQGQRRLLWRHQDTNRGGGTPVASPSARTLYDYEGSRRKTRRAGRTAHRVENCRGRAGSLPPSLAQVLGAPPYIVCRPPASHRDREACPARSRAHGYDSR